MFVREYKMIEKFKFYIEILRKGQKMSTKNFITNIERVTLSDFS